jgi:hypothetical protein
MVHGAGKKSRVARQRVRRSVAGIAVIITAR